MSSLTKKPARQEDKAILCQHTMVCIPESTCSEAYSPEKWDGYYIYIIYHGKNEETCYKVIKWRLLCNSFLFNVWWTSLINICTFCNEWYMLWKKEGNKQLVVCWDIQNSAIWKQIVILNEATEKDTFLIVRIHSFCLLLTSRR